MFVHIFLDENIHAEHKIGVYIITLFDLAFDKQIFDRCCIMWDLINTIQDYILELCHIYQQSSNIPRSKSLLTSISSKISNLRYSRCIFGNLWKKSWQRNFTLDNLTTGVQTELTNLGSFIALFSFRMRHFRWLAQQW